jgi:hypothetical protein
VSVNDRWNRLWMTNTEPGPKSEKQSWWEAKLGRKRSSEKMSFKILVKLRRWQREKQRLRFGVSWIVEILFARCFTMHGQSGRMTCWKTFTCEKGYKDAWEYWEKKKEGWRYSEQLKGFVKVSRFIRKKAFVGNWYGRTSWRRSSWFAGRLRSTELQ